jgi:hypothetical protein
MRSTVKLLTYVGLALAVSVIFADSVCAQTQPPGNDLKASVGIRVRPNRQNDRPGGTYVGDDMLPGESSRFNVAVGNGSDLCPSSVWTSSSTSPPSATMQAFAEKEEASAHYVWRFEVRMLEVVTDRIKFEITWQRTSRVVPGELLQRTQQLTMREGESRPIDLLHGTPGSDCISVALEVTASISDLSGPLGKALEWDLWLSPSAQAQSVHRALTSHQGESAAFRFDPMPVSAVQPGVAADGGTVHIYGQLRGRVRADGSIDVALTTDRWVSYGSSLPPTILARRPGPAGGSGQKNFTMKPGEAVKIVLPPFSNVLIQADPVTGARRGAVTVAAPTRAKAANEMSITIQAHVR